MKIPKKVMGLGGPITVKVVPKLRRKKDKLSGLWLPDTREIHLLDQKHSEMLHTYFHELAHAALYDSGQHNLLSQDGNEAIADLMGMARLRELEDV